MSRRSILPALLCVLSLAGCNALQQQSLKGPGWYVVKPTDSLYSVAWRYSLDFQDLAAWNGISDPYVIHPGQQLILIQPEHFSTAPMGEVARSDRPSAAQPVVVKKLEPSYNQAIVWRWPTKGELLNRFSFKDLDKRGIDIAGKVGQPVFSVADGKVVYSGTGLADYGNLIIVKHNNTFLSAYAYNSKRLVKEGDEVKRGAHIANMGIGKEKKPMLHFQVRNRGKPVDPLLYLPEVL